MYEESLKEFADAYCIQSRLALRYNEMGDFEKAEEHYRRAFELMPESFGRIESHCFGCEGAFTGELAQGIAERVFLKLAEETPDKAQVFYLLGYLRDQQGRKAEAAGHFRKAVEIDPDYFNAWGKLSSLAEETGMSREERDRIILERYRLNPNGANLSDVSSPAKVWDMALEAEERFTPIDTSPVFVLRNSSAPKENAYGNYYRINEQQTPRKQITRQESVSDVIRLLEYLGQG